jgi:hydrogenase maturation protease
VKSVLVIGLGNDLVGDDGIGGTLVERLAHESGLRHRADFLAGGCDLLRLADRMEGRRKVVIIDAVLSDAPPGTVSVVEEPFQGLDGAWTHAHHPSLVDSIGLLRVASPTLRGTSFTLIGVAVAELNHRSRLAAKAPEITARVGDALTRLTSRSGRR